VLVTLTEGSVGDLNRSGRPSVSDETDAVREAFQRSPGKSTRRASNELRVPQSTVFKILHKKKMLHFEKKSLYSTYSSFLVINVCNQGKTL